jgi:hypothetical protein
MIALGWEVCAACCHKVASPLLLLYSSGQSVDSSWFFALPGKCLVCLVVLRLY